MSEAIEVLFHSVRKGATATMEGIKLVEEMRQAFGQADSRAQQLLHRGSPGAEATIRRIAAVRWDLEQIALGFQRIQRQLKPLLANQEPEQG